MSAPSVLKATSRAATACLCPFLKVAKEAVSLDNVSTLVKTLGAQCPYLRRSGFVDPEGLAEACESCPAKSSLKKARTEHMVEARLTDLRNEGRYRTFFDIKRKAGNYPMASHADQDVTVWCNNDYLGMGQHPAVIKAMTDAVHTVGAGAGGTRNISGTTPYHTELERQLAKIHRHESALVFSSGYVANEAALSTLGSLLPGCHFFSDSLNHASMIAGMRHSRAKKSIWRHNDYEHLEQLLSEADPDVPKVVVFESVYSMDGDIANIDAICDVADKHGALTFIDEVHAVGLYGRHGAGIAERDNVQSRLSMVSGTLGKAFGCFGGYVTGSSSMMDFIRGYAPGFIFTTAIPPSVAAGALASVNVLQGQEGRSFRKQHQERAAKLKEVLQEAGLPVMQSESHIVPVIIGDARLCKQATDKLLHEHNIYVQPINYPTVPVGTERLRLTPTPLHDNAKMGVFRDSLLSVWKDLGMPISAC